MTVAIPFADGTLEGLFVQGTCGCAVVAPPHPLYGGRMDNPVVEELRRALAGAGLTVLAFNWRGVGSSDGRPSGNPDDAVADYEAALSYLAGIGHEANILAGYSYGAAAATLVAPGRPDVERLVLVAPPVSMMPAGAFAAAGRPLTIVLGEHDEFAPTADVSAALDGVNATLDIVPGADHFFLAGMDGLAASLGQRLSA